MEQRPHLLLVEDDQELGAILVRSLSQHGFSVMVAGDGLAMDQALAAEAIDLVMLDVMLPGEDGLSLCRRLRSSSNLPILMLTALGEEADRVVGLELGADDYVIKPFGTRELVARIRALLRRVARMPIPAGAPRSTRALNFAGWKLDPGTRQLHDPEGVRVMVTGAEFDLLMALCQHSGRVLTRDQILDLTHGQSAAPFDRSVDILVSRVRRKLERDPRQPELIVTVRSGGYMFTPQVANV